MRLEQSQSFNDSCEKTSYDTALYLREVQSLWILSGEINYAASAASVAKSDLSRLSHRLQPDGPCCLLSRDATLSRQHASSFSCDFSIVWWTLLISGPSLWRQGDSCLRQLLAIRSLKYGAMDLRSAWHRSVNFFDWATCIVYDQRRIPSGQRGERMDRPERE